MTRRGFTLMEIVVCIILISVCTILVVGLIPQGIISIKDAENVETARVYGTQVAETLAAGTPVTSPIDINLNNTVFHVESTVTPVTTGSGINQPNRLSQCVVLVTWPDHKIPVRIATRWYAP